MVGWGEGLIYWSGTPPLAAIGVEPLWIDDPLAPAELLKVHPHVHLPAQWTLALLLRGLVSRSRSGSSPSVVLVPVVVPLVPGAPLHGDVLGVLSCADESRPPVGVLPGEDHHHDPVGRRVMNSLLIFPLLLPDLGLLHPLVGVFLIQPALQHLGHVEHLPGGRGHGRRRDSHVSQEQPGLRTVSVRTLNPVGVVDVNGGLGGLHEGWEADAELCELDVVTSRHGGQVKSDGPSFPPLLAACKTGIKESMSTFFTSYNMKPDGGFNPPDYRSTTITSSAEFH